MHVSIPNMPLIRMNYTGMKKTNTAKLKITPVFDLRMNAA